LYFTSVQERKISLNIHGTVELEREFGIARLRLMLGDITEQSCDAIVNAANPSLMGGGGVDGAIHRKGGPVVLRECIKIRSSIYKDGLPVGEAVVTTAGALKAKYIIHTVGPVWRGGGHGEAQLLSKAYVSSLTLATRLGVRSLAFPSISTGAYGYPVEEASKVALGTVSRFLKTTPGTLEDVIFILYKMTDFEAYAKTLAGL